MANTIAMILIKIGVEVKEMKKGMKQIEGKLKNIGKRTSGFAGVMEILLSVLVLPRDWVDRLH